LCSVRTVGRPWRVSASTEGVEDCDSAISQASAVSTASAGRNTIMLGVARSMARCSTGWCVGPSSPSPIESCVITYCTGTPISAESRIEGRA
jgi:7-cyano-7-deazaguanine synthase in queuosine biosynthesis